MQHSPITTHLLIYLRSSFADDPLDPHARVRRRRLHSAERGAMLDLRDLDLRRQGSRDGPAGRHGVLSGEVQSLRGKGVQLRWTAITAMLPGLSICGGHRAG